MGGSLNNVNEIEELKRMIKDKLVHFVNRGELSKAKAIIDEAEVYLKNDDEFLSIKGTIYIMEGRLSEAKKILKEALTLNSKNEDILYNLGYLYKLEGDSLSANVFYAKAFSQTKSSDLKEQIIDDMKNIYEDFIHKGENTFAGKRILIGGPIHQEPSILKEFLSSVTDLEEGDMAFDYFFVDDNLNNESSVLLQQFSEKHKNTTILKSQSIDCYIKDDNTHNWTDKLIWKVAAFKNQIIQNALENGYDYLFLVDSDLLLHSKVIKRLISAEKDIISCIFWTKWNKESDILPQVWMSDSYNQFYRDRNEKLTQDEIIRRHKQFLNTMDTPGVYEVGGLGACTLISKNALVKGVNFNEIKNISFIGEDRHFCVRAASLGISLWVDTYYPAYHIYRMEDLGEILDYRIKNYLIDGSPEKYRIALNIKEGIEKLKTYNCSLPLDNGFNKYFVRETVNSRIIQHRERDITAGITSNKSKVMDLKFITFDEESGHADVSIIVKDSGYKDSISTYSERIYRVKVKRDLEGQWLISELEYMSDEKLFSCPLIRIAKPSGNRLTLSMVVKNEADRYLKEVLMSLREYIDEAVIIDDGSTDGSGELCQELLAGIPLKLIRNSDSKFSNEVELRKQQWIETVKINPDWILNLDGDEIFEKNFTKGVRNLINQHDIDVYAFRLFDFWDNNHYREDMYWYAHMVYRPFLLRYQPNFNYTWRETRQHCGRFPNNILELPAKNAEYRLKHLGWARKEDRLSKYDRYMKLDPESKFGWKEQYESILDESPNLLEWIE